MFTERLVLKFPNENNLQINTITIEMSVVFFTELKYSWGAWVA